MAPNIETQNTKASDKLEPFVRPFKKLRDRVNCILDERKVNKWKQRLASFKPGCIKLGRFEELHDLSVEISSKERLARVELVRTELEILINHVMTLEPWWKEGALEKYAELSSRIDQLEEKNLADVNTMARELNKHIKATLHNTALDFMN